MTDTSNFVNGRLRLATFLRTVELQGGLKRPRRFREPDASHEKMMDAQIHESTYTTASELLPIDLADFRGSASQSLAEGNPPMDHNAYAETTIIHSEDNSVAAPASFALLDLPIAGDRSASYYSGQPTRNGTADRRSTRAPPPKPIAISHGSPSMGRVRDGSAVLRKTAPKESSRTRNSARSTRKRRLPFRELTLIRTTNTNGLPLPHVRHTLRVPNSLLANENRTR